MRLVFDLFLLVVVGDVEFFYVVNVVVVCFLELCEECCRRRDYVCIF